MRKVFIPFLFLLVLLSFTYSREYTQDYNNALTRSIGDSIYCMQDGECNLTILNVENQTVININVTGDIDNRPYSVRSNNVNLSGDLIVNGSIITGDGIITDRDIIANSFNGSWNGSILYARLDGSNQPFTGNLEIQKSVPDLMFHDTDGIGHEWEFKTASTGASFSIQRDTTTLLTFNGNTGFRTEAGSSSEGFFVPNDKDFITRDIDLYMDSPSDGTLRLNSDQKLQLLASEDILSTSPNFNHSGLFKISQSSESRPAFIINDGANNQFTIDTSTSSILSEYPITFDTSSTSTFRGNNGGNSYIMQIIPASRKVNINTTLNALIVNASNITGDLYGEWNNSILYIRNDSDVNFNNAKLDDDLNLTQATNNIYYGSGVGVATLNLDARPQTGAPANIFYKLNGNNIMTNAISSSSITFSAVSGVGLKFSTLGNNEILMTSSGGGNFSMATTGTVKFHKVPTNIIPKGYEFISNITYGYNKFISFGVRDFEPTWKLSTAKTTSFTKYDAVSNYSIFSANLTKSVERFRIDYDTGKITAFNDLEGIGNVTLNQMLKLAPITIQASSCNVNTNGSFARNITGDIYLCNRTAKWKYIG